MNMKKILLFLAVPFIFLSSLTAQITQEQADEIVINHMNDETKPHTIFAKEEVQIDGFAVITSTGEALELEYSCWIYYVNYAEETNGKYLIVKENNGNLLAVNTKNDEIFLNLQEWRVVPIEIPFENYSLAGTSCYWTNFGYGDELIVMNNHEDLENYIICNGDYYPPINFSEYTLLRAHGMVNGNVYELTKKLLRLAPNEYELSIEVFSDDAGITGIWCVVIIVEKLSNESNIELKVNIKF